MVPVIAADEGVLVREGARVHVGDVVAVRGASGLVGHRVVGVVEASGRRFVLHRGDGARRTAVAGGHRVVGRVEGVVGADRRVRVEGLHRAPGVRDRVMTALCCAFVGVRLDRIAPRRVRDAAFLVVDAGVAGVARLVGAA
jgi:hypothetical protein